MTEALKYAFYSLYDLRQYVRHNELEKFRALVEPLILFYADYSVSPRPGTPLSR